MITIEEKENRLLVYQDDKLIAEDGSIRFTLEINEPDLKLLSTTISGILSNSDYIRAKNDLKK